MRKLKLELTELEVTSFDTDAVRTQRPGTVAGQEATNTYCNGDTCDWITCAESCLDSCGAMCYSGPATNCEFCFTGLAESCPC